jgi:hypothetical protein
VINVFIFLIAEGTVSPARLGRVDWTDELLNWITKYEMIEVALTLVDAMVPCGDALIRQEI